MRLWLTADPTHLAGRLKVNIHPLAVVTAVSYRIGDDFHGFMNSSFYLFLLCCCWLLSSLAVVGFSVTIVMGECD